MDFCNIYIAIFMGFTFIANIINWSPFLLILHDNADYTHPDSTTIFLERHQIAVTQKKVRHSLRRIHWRKRIINRSLTATSSFSTDATWPLSGDRGCASRRIPWSLWCKRLISVGMVYLFFCLANQNPKWQRCSSSGPSIRSGRAPLPCRALVHWTTRKSWATRKPSFITSCEILRAEGIK